MGDRGATITSASRKTAVMTTSLNVADKLGTLREAMIFFVLELASNVAHVGPDVPLPEIRKPVSIQGFLVLLVLLCSLRGRQHGLSSAATVCIM